MKSDELKFERLGDANKTYPESTLVIRKQFVDAAIAELKDENAEPGIQGKETGRKEGQGGSIMQTIEEYKAYTKQLEDEVGKWHHAYDALVIERNQMATTLRDNKKIIEMMAAELDELRKHEVEWDLSKARIRELEQSKEKKQWK